MISYGEASKHGIMHASWCRVALTILVAVLLKELVLLHGVLLERHRELAQLLGIEVAAALETMRDSLMLYGAMAAAVGAAVLPLVRVLALGLLRHLPGPALDLVRPLAGAAGEAPATGGVAVSATVAQAATAPMTEIADLAAREFLDPFPGKGCPGAVGTGEERNLERAERCHWGYVLEMSRVMRTQAISVLGLIELLLAGRLSEVQRGYAETVRFSGKMLLSTSSDIINLIRIDVGNVHPVAETFEVRTLLDQVVGKYCQAARCKDVDLVAEVAPEVPHQLVGDLGGLGRVLSNLVEHAVHMTTSGKIAVSLRSPEAPSGDLNTVHLLCEVQDTGAGLAPEVQARIFGRFCEVEAPPLQAVEIEQRLRLTRNLLELMGCHLAVVSNVGVGSTFWFKIPLLRVADARKAPVPLPDVGTGPVDATGAGDESETAVRLATPGPAGREVGPPRILLVENDYDHQTLCLVMLEALACRVSVAGSTACALELLSRQQFDLILLDGQVHCLALAARLRRAEAVASPEGHRHLPVIALAPHDELQQGLHAWHAAGIDAWLAKPFTLGSLARELGKWLPGRLRVGGSGVNSWPGPGTGNRAGDGQPRGTSVIDERVLESIRMVERGSPNLLASLVDCFFLESPRHLDDLRAALRNKAWPEVRNAAHNLRSCGALLGARGLADLCQNLEVRCVAGVPVEAEMLLARIEAENSRVCRSLAELRRDDEA